jgi:hypothetical protein
MAGRADEKHILDRAVVWSRRTSERRPSVTMSADATRQRRKTQNFGPTLARLSEPQKTSDDLTCPLNSADDFTRPLSP